MKSPSMRHNESSSLRVRALRGLGVALLVYTFAMTFGVPLGPGLERVDVLRSEITENGGAYELQLTGVGTHFADTASLVFVRSVGSFGQDPAILNATAIKAASNEDLKCRVRLPKYVPSQAWDVFVNNPIDGTISYANGFFAEGVQPTPKAGLKDDRAVLSRLAEADLPFHFPFQPNIMESIRNLMLHVPMWFTMFLLMGISFAQSIRVLRIGGDAARDRRAVAAVKVGLWFGVLGLLTGSLWARWTWGAWWVDDPQLNGAFVTVMVYAGYLVLRGSIQDEALRERLSAVYNLFGFALLVVLLMVLPRFTESLHPGKGGNPAFSSYDLDSALRAAFYPAVVGWMILGTWMYAVALRIENLRARLYEAKRTAPGFVPGDAPRPHPSAAAHRAALPALLLPAQASGLEAFFVADGKMPVVAGVAVIIVAGLAAWWALHLAKLRALRRELDHLNPEEPAS